MTAINAEPNWSDDVELYLGPRVPAAAIATIVTIAALVALGITLALGF